MYYNIMERVFFSLNKWHIAFYINVDKTLLTNYWQVLLESELYKYRMLLGHRKNTSN